ncbi:imidazoleglycerol-phosphate dehydratase HisB [Fibrobacterota bacterium]
MESTRKTTEKRKTKETDIELTLDLDTYFEGEIKSGSGFLDHMLDLFRKHSGMGLSLICEGDTEVDMHHSCEDIAICLGSAILKAVGDKKDMERFGFYYVPMDEALVRAVLDLSGRISFEFSGDIQRNTIGNFETEMAIHFFKTIAQSGKMNLHLDIIRGRNAHHCIEGMFKAFARALAMAVSSSSRIKGVPSTKGIL